MYAVLKNNIILKYQKNIKICKRKFSDKYSKEIASYFNISTNLRN